MVCPECLQPLIWGADHQEEEEVMYSFWSCQECEIDVSKRFYLMYDESENLS